MVFKLAVIACILAIANAGYLAPSYVAPTVAHYASPGAYAPSVAVASHSITSQSDNILRSPGNLAQISTQQKTISTPYSSQSKSDVRVSNPGVYANTAYAAAPSYAHGTPAGLLGVAYSPAVAVSHMTYSSPVGISYTW